MNKKQCANKPQRSLFKMELENNLSTKRQGGFGSSAGAALARARWAKHLEESMDEETEHVSLC